MSSHRLNITLDGEQASKLTQLAARVHVNEGTLARSLPSSAIDGADPDPDNIVAVLDGIDGAWERAQLGLEHARVGDTVALEDGRSSRSATMRQFADPAPADEVPFGGGRPRDRRAREHPRGNLVPLDGPTVT